MPVEIKELIVRAVATEAQPAASKGSSSGCGSGGGGSAGASGGGGEVSPALVEACVQQVLKILKRSGER